MDELVSVVITTYKRPFKLLERAILSVLNQSYKNLEVIVVNDSPKEYLYKKDIEQNINLIRDNRIKYIVHEDNMGACKARNTGIENSSGGYIAFLDDDDEWLTNKVELQMTRFTDVNVGLVYCDSYTVSPKDDKSESKVIRQNRIKGSVYDRLIERNFIGSTSFVMVRKAALDNCGVFNNNIKSSQDYELWLRIAKKYKVDYVDSPLVNYYLHEGERISANTSNKIQGMEKVIDLNIDYLRANPRVFCKRRLDIVPFYQSRDGLRKALEKWFEAFKIHPLYSRNLKFLGKIIRNQIRYRI